MAAQCAWTLHRPLLIIRGYWYSLLILCMATVGIVVKPERWKIDILFMSVAIAAAMPSLIILRWRWHRQFKGNFSLDTNIIATVDERGVKLAATQGAQKTHLWASFSQIYESRRVVMLEKDPNDFLFLPKSVMNSGQLAELKRLAESAPNCKVKLAAPLA